MKIWKRLLAALLAVAMICALVACVSQKDQAGKSVTVTFYNGDQIYETMTVLTGEKLTLPEAPKAEKGLGLAGWSTIDGDVEEIIDPDTFIVRGDLKLYAVWADVFTVTINADNGTPFEVKKVLAGSLLEKPADPEKEGFRFVEWRDALKDITFDFDRPIYEDVILKAMYGDGSPNRITDTLWDFSSGIHGSWIGAQGGWKYEVNGLKAEDMVYKTTEDGYAAWGFTLTDSLDNIPEVNGNNAPGLGMKYIYNEGINVEASKAKVVVIYLKPKYYPIDMTTSPEDQFRISVLTSNGGMIYGYGNGSEAWSLRTDGAGANLIQVDQMEDGWLRVQFKIHKLDVWSEDATIKSMAISFVQRKSNPVMDIISVKSIELLDQEDFVDAQQAEHTTKSQWNMSNAKDAADWGAYHAKKKNDSLSTNVSNNGMSVTYHSPGNGWKGIILENAMLDISKLTGNLSFTYSSDMPITSYRIHILTDLGGKLTANGTEDCYVAANISDIDAGKLSAWRRTVNADGSITVNFDLNSLGYYANGEELKGLTIVTVTANKVTGTVTYKSIEIEKDLSEHDCQVEGHYMKEASCIAPMTCYVCGATEGGVEEHIWEAATCQTPKTCSVCRTTEGTVSDHSWKVATCQTPMTCRVCGKKEGSVAAHSYAEGFCSVCGIPEVIRTEWNMSNAKAAADWTGYHAKKKNEALITTVTSDGKSVEYLAPGNGWKGIILENTQIETNKLTGKLTFTYSSDMAITSYRIHILTDRGGKLTANGTDACYVAASIADIKAGNLEAWTQTTNADGTVTVTFDLRSLSDFAKGKVLKGLTIVTVTSNNTTGTVTYKNIDLEVDVEGYDCQAGGHLMKDATCTEPRTCRVCGATDGDAAGHTWIDATCTEPKICSVCGTTDGEPNDHVDADGDYKCDICDAKHCANHNWSEATCTAPKTCSICGAIEGEKLPHTDADKNHVCDVCESSLTIWYMNTAEDAADWTGYHAKKKNEELTTTVTETGFNVAYGGGGNGWKGIVLENVALDISKLTGKLTFTYSSDMDITNYRIHILTDRGGDLTANGTADCYVNVSIANIVAGNLEAWTQTTNADGTVTVTFDLDSLSYFADGTELNGLTIVTVTANNTTGNVTYKFIALDDIDTKHDCQQSGHNWISATCTAPKTCSACGTTEGEPLDHAWVDADCVTAKTCSVCGETEGEALGHAWVEDVCLKTCYICGATESTSVAHTYENGSCSICGAKQWDTDGDGVLEILTLGNSFSVDATEYSWQIAKSLGIDKVVVGNLYIGSCSLNTHMANANADSANYRYYYCDDGTWISTENYKLSTALESRSWDYVSLQQASGVSGVESTYNEDLTNLIAYIKERSDAKLVWHMTWAYQQDSTHDAFPTYGSDQMTMYNAIVSAVQNKVVTNSDIDLIVPNGTAVQNARTSLIGDTLTRDGYHMSKGFGRYLTGLMLVKTVTGLDISEITYAPAGVSRQYRDIAVESVNNAYAQPFAVTQSAYQGEVTEVTRNNWDMSKEEAADWAAYYNKVKDHDNLSAEVTPDGLRIDYKADNGWRAVILENAAIDISKLTGKLTFTYSTDMTIKNYRIHVLTDAGGKLTANGEAGDWYAQEDFSAITSEGTGAWTQTVNADRSITVTFDLSALKYYREGTELRGLSIVTATANNAVGHVTFKSIELEVDICRINGHTWADATCTAPKTCSICGETEGEALGHDWADADCETAKTCNTCGETEGEALGHTWVDATCQTLKTCSVCGTTEGELGSHADGNGDSKCDVCDEILCTNHTWNDATCTDPKTCSICGTAEGEALGHDWADADCDTAKTCNTCGETEGEALGHTWSDATCLDPKTCSACGETEGEATGHTFVEGVCTVCGATAPPITATAWDMSNEEEAADWGAYHDKIKDNKLSAEVTDKGLRIDFEAGNGWRAVILKNAAIDISKLTGKLTFTYSTDMVIKNYRIHVLTDAGGELTVNGTAGNWYAQENFNAITSEGTGAWTQTVNADRSITVTFDLTTLSYFTNGTKLEGLSIVTATANNAVGHVTFQSIELQEDVCRINGHTWADATCTTPKTCSICGTTEGEALGHDWVDADCDTAKTCSVCGETEGEALGHTWIDATCQTLKTCSVCNATEGELGSHADEDEDRKCDICEENLCTDHDWDDATCTVPKTCSICGTIEGEALGHDWADADCDTAKTCNTCGETEGEALGHTWADATCLNPKTCSVCGTTEGELAAHTFAEGVCTVCGTPVPPTTATAWDMSNENAAADWGAYHDKIKDNKLSAEVTDNGLRIDFEAGNGWRAVILKNAAIDISKLTGKLTFTYSTNMTIKNYRIHILTDAGGALTTNGTAGNWYAQENFSAITSEGTGAWTQTINADNSITVTFDLSTLNCYSEGTKLEGLSIVTATANSAVGHVTFKSIELEVDICRNNGHTWADATCSAPKTCSICGATEGEALGHDWVDADCETAKTCNTCGATEGEALGHDWADADCDTAKTCSVCGETEGEALGHDWVDADCETAKTCNACGETEGEALGHTWADATCTAPKTCSVCNETEGEVLGHDWADADCDTPKTCNRCGATEGEALGHNFVDGVCTVCGTPVPPTTATTWDMSNENAVADWAAYQGTTKNNKLSTTVTANGLKIDYQAENGWRAVILEKADIDISKLTGKLTFTYSTDMALATYRIHILTDAGGSLTTKGSGAYAYIDPKTVTAEGTSGWTKTVNADDTITVTFDLTTLSCFTNGTNLKGLSIVTATANNAVGHVTFKSIELERTACAINGHTWADATCAAPKTCSVCGETEGEALAHTFEEGVCTACGAPENPPVTSIVWDMTNAAAVADWTPYLGTSGDTSYTTTVTDAGWRIDYNGNNGWKAVVLEEAAIDISNMTGTLSFTYSTDMTLDTYRIHILTNEGGSLTAKGSGAYVYIDPDTVTAEGTSGWTKTVNADNTITVTFDLTTLSCFADGEKLYGLSIVTATGSTTGTVTYKSIEIR